MLSYNGWCGSLCSLKPFPFLWQTVLPSFHPFVSLFLASHRQTAPPAVDAKQEAWQLETALGPLVFSHSMFWQRSPEVQTHTHRAPIVADFPSPLILIWNAAGNPWFPDTRQAGGSKGKTPLKSPAFVHVRCEVENGEDSAKFHCVFSQAGKGESRVKPSSCWNFQIGRKSPEFSENEGFLTQTDREKGQSLWIILPRKCVC